MQRHSPLFPSVSKLDAVLDFAQWVPLPCIPIHFPRARGSKQIGNLGCVFAVVLTACRTQKKWIEVDSVAAYGNGTRESLKPCEHMVQIPCHGCAQRKTQWKWRVVSSTRTFPSAAFENEIEIQISAQWTDAWAWFCIATCFSMCMPPPSIPIQIVYDIVDARLVVLSPGHHSYLLAKVGSGTHGPLFVK